MVTKKKVVLVGDAGVGKTSLLKKFFGEDIGGIRNTIGIDFYTYSKENNTVIFWDFAGQRMFRELLLDFVRGASVIILVFDLSRPRTMMSLLEYWLPKIKSYVEKNAKFIVVGNKRDIKKINEDSVRSLIKKLEKEHNIETKAYIETSALRNENVDKLLSLINELFSG